MSDYTVNKTRVNMEAALLMDELVAETDYLVKMIEIDIRKKMLRGMTQKAAKAQALSDIAKGEGIYGAWFNRMNKKIAVFDKDQVASPIESYAEQNPKAVFAWVLGSVKTSHCPDCIKLSGMAPRTAKNWRKLGYGLPREGQTACSYGCQCMLEEVDG